MRGQVLGDVITDAKFFFENRCLTDAVAGVVRTTSTWTDNRVTAAGVIVELIAFWAGARYAAERPLDVVTISRHTAVVSSQPTLVVVFVQQTTTTNIAQRNPMQKISYSLI